MDIGTLDKTTETKDKNLIVNVVVDAIHILAFIVYAPALLLQVSMVLIGIVDTDTLPDIAERILFWYLHFNHFFLANCILLLVVILCVAIGVTFLTARHIKTWHLTNFAVTLLAGFCSFLLANIQC